MAVLDESYNLAVRRQVMLERLKAGHLRDYEQFLKKVDKVLRDQLSRSELTEFSRDRVRSLLKDTRGKLQTIYSQWQTSYEAELGEVAANEVAWEIRSLNQAVSDIAPAGFSFVVPALPQLQSAVFNTPLHVTGTHGGKLLKPFLKDFTTVQVQQLEGIIRQGYYEGKTNTEILRVIRGTRANRFQDGVLGVSTRHARAITSTAVQHMAQGARDLTWEANSDIIKGVRWVSTLDSRTTQQCRSLDGMIFPHKKGPRPPIHINCRSTTISELDDDLAWLQEGRTRASMNGQVKDQTYYEWIQTQPKSFQDEVLGPTRAKLLRDGGLSANEFARLNLGRDFQPLTLKEMKRKDPLVFDRAGVEV